MSRRERLPRRPLKDPAPTGGLEKTRVYERILLDVVCGDLPPGSPLSEAALQRRCGSGIAAVRDALTRLALEGIVERRPRVGTIVAPLDIMDLYQVFEARIAIEGHCAALAAQLATTGDLEILESAFAGHEAVLHARNFRHLVQMDQMFHRGLAAATQNAWLRRVVTLLHNSAARFWHFSLAHRSEDAIQKDIRYHLDVATAVRDRNAMAAEQAMRDVLGLFPESVKGMLLGAFELTADRRPRMIHSS